jgi:hypothetical protein
MTRARTTSPLTRNQKKKMSEVPNEVKLWKVVPGVLRNEIEQGELLEDLQTMGCSGFLEKPWGFKDDWVVRELLDGVSNKFDNSIRAAPIRWTEECWREVYHFSTGGGGLAAGRTSTSKTVSRICRAPKMGMPSRTARIRDISGCSRFSCPLCIRRSRTGLLLLGVTRSLER